jgi:hypothetical protein
MSPTKVHVFGVGEGNPWSEVAAALRILLGVDFCFGSADEVDEAVGRLLVGSGQTNLGSKSRLPTLQVPALIETTGDSKLTNFNVRFSDDPDVPFPFRGRSLSVKVAGEPVVLTPSGGEKALACGELGPIWLSSTTEGLKHFRSALPLPGLPPGGALVDILNGNRFLEFLPLLHWLREAFPALRYEGPSLRAGFIFDDPNLHWPRYGFADYSQIAEHAAKENYHVSFATIPLDTWFTHPGTAAIFRNHASRLSLCVHGNNHTRQELARERSPAEREHLVSQALARIERLERNARLRVCRVMVPPHGACAEAMLGDLARCGFEAASISHGSLRAHNRAQPWTRHLGFRPSEVIRGCAVLPRWGFAPDLTNTILLAGFLKQAIILRGHHQDLRGGIEMLDHHARFINSLGPVAWSNLTGLSRSNYQWRCEGDVCHLKPFSRLVHFQSPEHAAYLRIEGTNGHGVGRWEISSPGGTSVQAGADEKIALPEGFRRELSVKAMPESPVPRFEGVDIPVLSALMRRLATEGRDRLLR